MALDPLHTHSLLLIRLGKTVLNAALKGDHHFFLDHFQPSFNADPCPNFNRLRKVDLFAFRADHSLQIGRVLIWGQQKFVEVVEKFVKMAFNLRNFLLMGQKLK